MDGTRFDGWARRLGVSGTRRGLLRGVLGGAAVMAAGGLVADEAAARCNADGVRCNRDAACCSGHCNWSVVTRGRRQVRVGTCGPEPVADCSQYSGANLCLYTVNGRVIVADAAYTSGNCAASADCIANSNCFPGYPCDCMTQRYNGSLDPAFVDFSPGGKCMAYNEVVPA